MKFKAKMTKKKNYGRKLTDRYKIIKIGIKNNENLERIYKDSNRLQLIKICSLLGHLSNLKKVVVIKKKVIQVCRQMNQEKDLIFQNMKMKKKNKKNYQSQISINKEKSKRNNIKKRHSRNVNWNLKKLHYQKEIGKILKIKTQMKKSFHRTYRVKIVKMWHLIAKIQKLTMRVNQFKLSLFKYSRIKQTSSQN